MIKATHWILNVIFVSGWISFYLLQLYYLIPSLMNHCVFWGNTLKPADVNYRVFLFFIFLSVLIGMIVCYQEKRYFYLSIFNKIKIILLNIFVTCIWGYLFYIGIKELSIYFGIERTDCLF